MTQLANDIQQIQSALDIENISGSFRLLREGIVFVNDLGKIRKIYLRFLLFWGMNRSAQKFILKYFARNTNNHTTE